MAFCLVGTIPINLLSEDERMIDKKAWLTEQVVRNYTKYICMYFFQEKYKKIITVFHVYHLNGLWESSVFGNKY